MADETLPELWALDMAAKAAGLIDYGEACDKWRFESDSIRSIIAHARTLEALAKHDPSIKPVDEDLLIAREICARVAEDWTDDVPQAYRDGNLDDEPEVQFALSMLKRDPEALAAFRKEKGL